MSNSGASDGDFADRAGLFGLLAHAEQTLASIDRLRADISTQVNAVIDGRGNTQRVAGPVRQVERLVELVEEAEDNGAKVIVFSYFLKVLDVIGGSLPGTVFGPLTGAMSSAACQALVDEFTAHPAALCCCPRSRPAASDSTSGAASVVIIAEPQWKPSTEAQAIARAHRMGQVRTVQVHRIRLRAASTSRCGSIAAQGRTVRSVRPRELRQGNPRGCGGRRRGRIGSPPG